MKQIFIVFDSGPCGGKTVGMRHAAKVLRAEGYIVLTVPEAATLLIDGGLNTQNLGIRDFQKPNYELQASMESLWLKYAKQLSEKEGKDVIILCDRGRLSGAAYVPDFFEMLSSEYGVLAGDVHGEYVGVIHLVTAADGAEAFYTLDNNTARSEDPAQARELDKKTLAAWQGHPNVHVIANRTDAGVPISFDEKLKLAVQAVLGMIQGMSNDQSSEEIEREAKASLTKEEYAHLLAYLSLSAEAAKKQVNSFYDTDDLRLNASDITLRTREKKGIWELTLKEDAPGGGRRETNHRPFDDKQRDLLSHGVVAVGNVFDALMRIGIPGPYLHHGDLTTYRIEIPHEGCKLALDWNQYLDMEDYEVEMERDAADADEHASLMRLLQEAGIPYRPSMGKRKRFFRQKSLQEA